jgi:SAM-dependent methyltransferase
MHPNRAEEIFNDLFANVDGYALASQGKQKLGKYDSHLTYGEISWDSFLDIIAEVQYLNDHKIFYDLGSGTGKAVIAAALLGNFSHVLGVELLPELYKEAKKVLLKFNKNVRPNLHPANQKVVVDYIHNDLFDHDWSNGDVVFMQTTCFNENLMERLEEQAESLKPGSMVITLSKYLRSPSFKIVTQKKYPFGWGEATVFIHKKI